VITTAVPPAASWIPDQATVAAANVTTFAAELDIEGYEALHAWSVDDRAAYWAAAIRRLGIVFDRTPSAMMGRPDERRDPGWLPGARLNIAASCFTTDPDRIAVVAGHGGAIERLSYGALQSQVARFGNSLRSAGLGPGDRVAIAMPMTIEAVVAYLGAVAAGCVVVSIADSFAEAEIAVRLRITETALVVTQDLNTRSGRRLPMYEKVKQAGAPRCVVVATGGGVPLAGGDTWWDDFVGSNEAWSPEICAAGSHTNILFSSGTTGEPKAIPWTHLTPIKAAADGHFHHDIHSGDVVAWPTNLGWMMGPWLIYASLVNDATMALYDEAPTGREFGEFVRDAGVTVLGLVPSIVAAWRTTGCMDGIDLTGLRLLSSTGEASNPDDMAWLMGLVGNKPVIEYCGGTEIGGGYITGTVVQPAVPSCFSTPALGIALVVLDEGGRRAGEGEVYIVPPSIGLSTELINRDHDEVYHDGVPDIGIPLRRHGDRMEALAGGYYRAKGRVDDTMNLGGIKVAAADIERAVAGIDGLTETAAIAVPPPGGGPDRLVLYAVTEGPIDPDRLRADMQRRIRDVLNPLFRIHEVVVVDSLPRTASAKVMRRRLRAGYGDR